MLSVASGLLLDGYHSPIFNKKYKKTCYITNTARLRPRAQALKLIDLGNRGIRGSLQHRLSAKRLADAINMWSNVVLAFNHPLVVQIVCLVFCLYFLKCLQKSENCEKNESHGGYTTSLSS